jgi:hypothetical protein
MFVLLSANDAKKDSAGNLIRFYEGMPVSVYEENAEDGEPDNLIADGIAASGSAIKINPYWAHVKWVCLIDENGIRHESDLRRETDGNNKA